jgi:hypothetical protein
MKKLLVVCLLRCLAVLVFWSVAAGAESFALADRVGEPGERSLFIFSTSAGKYIHRQDWMGEFTSPKGMRRVYRLRVKGSIERVYFLEHDGDVFICYEVNEAAYLVRMEQTKRTLRWSTQIANIDVPRIEGDVVIVNDTQIRKGDGRVIGQD